MCDNNLTETHEEEVRRTLARMHRLAEQYKTIEDIAQHFVAILNDDDREYVAGDNNQMDLVNRSIRNDYGLWHCNDLTKNWRENESTRDVRDGVDYSHDHPDNVSELIRQRAVILLNQRKGI